LVLVTGFIVHDHTHDPSHAHDPVHDPAHDLDHARVHVHVHCQASSGLLVSGIGLGVILRFFIL
jgi:hypothetical protein